MSHLFTPPDDFKRFSMSSSHSRVASTGEMSSMTPQTPKRKKISILDLPINTKKKEVSLSAFSFLFSEIIQYSQSRVTTATELENKLSDIGFQIGYRIYELCVFRDRNSKRETKLVPLLQFIHSTVWKTLFGKTADALQKSTQNMNEYMIYEKESLVTQFISLPKNLSGLKCEYFTAGIIKGCLYAAEYPATDVRVCDSDDGNWIVYLIVFDDSVINREQSVN